MCFFYQAWFCELVAEGSNMIGLMYLLFFSAYALISLAVVVGAVKWARKRGRSTFRWGFAAAFIMYNLVFWDWVPSIIQHEYYCRTKAGFWVYKTLDQWKAENPGVLETLVVENEPPKSVVLPGNRGRIREYTLNQRIGWIVQYENLTFLGINVDTGFTQECLVDSDSGEILAKYIGVNVGNWGEWITFLEIKTMSR